MNEFDLLVDLHRDGERQGPGGDDETRRAIALSGLSGTGDLRIADIGCGTGASTLVLAEDLDAHVVGVDLFPEFLGRLVARAEEKGLSGRVDGVAASMDALPFADGSFDAVWSEGSVYNMGFERGISAWRRLLRPDGVLAVSELTWLTAQRPSELDEHWTREYPEVATASAKLAVLERNGYSPVGYFPLPDRCWLDGYYRPLQDRFAGFLDRHDHTAAARAIVAAEQREIALYERFSGFVSYGFFVARRATD